jgi:hypothetical protein
MAEPRGASYAHTGRDTIHSPDARQPYRYQSGARRDQSVSAPVSRPDPGTVVGTVFGRPGPYEPSRRYSETQGESATPARRPRDEAGRTQRRGSGGCRSRFASDRCSRARLSRASNTRSRSNRAGDSEPRAAYHRLPLSPAAASFAGTRYRHGHHQRQTPARTQRKAADAAGPQNPHRLGRTAEAPRASGRPLSSRPRAMLPVALAGIVDPQMPAKRFSCPSAGELDENSSLPIRMESMRENLAGMREEFAALARTI